MGWEYWESGLTPLNTERQRIIHTDNGAKHYRYCDREGMRGRGRGGGEIRRQGGEESQQVSNEDRSATEERGIGRFFFLFLFFFCWRELLSHWIGLMHTVPMGLFRNDTMLKWINSS